MTTNKGVPDHRDQTVQAGVIGIATIPTFSGPTFTAASDISHSIGGIPEAPAFAISVAIAFVLYVVLGYVGYRFLNHFAYRWFGRTFTFE